MDLTSMFNSLEIDPNPVVLLPELLENPTPSSVETWVSALKSGLLENSSSLPERLLPAELLTIEKLRDLRVSAMLNLLTPHPPPRLLLSSTDSSLMDALSDLICLLDLLEVTAVAVVAVVVVASKEVEAAVAASAAVEEAAVASVEAEVVVIEAAEAASAEGEVETEEAVEVVVAEEVDSMPTKTLTPVALLPSKAARCPSDSPYCGGNANNSFNSVA